MQGIGDVDAPARIHGDGVAVAGEIQDAVVIPVSHVEAAKRIHRQTTGEMQAPGVRPAAIARSLLFAMSAVKLPSRPYTRSPTALPSLAKNSTRWLFRSAMPNG